jgi:1-acyl-sn-glycerol-3-phosphate acyltransferase
LSDNLIIDAPDPRDQKNYYFQMTPTRQILTPIVKVIFSLFGATQARGVNHLPASGPVILAANHLTNYDVFPLQFVLPRPIFYMGKEELFRNPLMDSLLRQLGGFPVHRGAQDTWAIQHAERVLAHGQVLGIFPEGTRSKGHGLRPAKTGVARLAQSAGCPIVPVAIHGTQYMFRHFPRRTWIRIALGEPIYPEPDETHLGLTERVMFSMAAMLPPEARGAYRYHPAGF